MKKLNSILSIISLCITSFLLVLLVFAWYATNKTANVENATGSVASLPGLVEQVDYYNFNAKVGNDYTVETHIQDSGTCNMQKYDFPATKPTIYYIRIQLKQNTAINQIRFISSATGFVGFTSRTYPDPVNAGSTITRNDTNGVLLGDNKFLSLSSAIKFTYLGTTTSATTYVSGNTGTFSNLDSLTWKSFEYGSNGSITVSSINMLTDTIVASNNTQYIHLLLDYNVSALNEFYGNNLTNQDILNTDGGPSFTNKDFTIYLLG